MAKIGTEAKVGLAVLLGIVLLTFMTFRVEEYQFGRPEGYLIYAVFDSIAGVDEKAPVKIAGVKVGEVEHIELDGTKARVTLRIQPGVKIRKGAQALLRSTGLLGEKYIEIVVPEEAASEGPEVFPGPSSWFKPPGPIRAWVGWIAGFGLPSAHAAEAMAQEEPATGGPFVEEGEVIQQKGKSADIDQLVTQISAIADDLKAVSHTLREALGTPEGEESLKEILANVRGFTRNLKEVLEENSESVDRIVTNLKAFTESLAQISEKVLGGSGTFGKLLSDEDLYDQISATVTDLRQVAEKIQSGEGTIGKLIYNDEAYNRLNGTLADIKHITGKISKGEGSVGKLIFEEEAYDNLNRTLKGLSAGLDRVSQLRVFLSFRTEYQLQSSDSKGYFSVRLQPQDHKYYQVEVVDDPRGNVERTVVQTTGTDPASTTTLKTERKLKFSAQIARRFWGFWFRAGLVESTFGVGADSILFDDHLRLGLDIWDFNSDDPEMERSRLKFTADVSVLHYLFLQAGYDNILNRKVDTFFLGAAIRFEDDDLKYLLGSVVRFL